MIIKNLESIQNLIDHEIKESLNLDYKKQLTKNTEIAKDVSSFANNNGGKIIYGVDEKNGLPSSINWIDSKGVKEKIECVILDHIQPEIKGFNIYSIENPENHSRAVFVVDIPESSDAPHMANHRYYIRRNFKSEYMEDYEVKDAIFKKGLKESLDFEMNNNIELCSSSLKLLDEIYRYKPEQRKPIILIPFYSDAWKSITNSGLLFVLKENAQKLVEIYSLIHAINYLVDCQKHGLEIVNTPIHISKPDIGTYLPAILREKIAMLQGLLIKNQNP
jgi:hypothetical protein